MFDERLAADEDGRSFGYAPRHAILKIPFHEREKDFYELALKVSGAVQAARWTRIDDGTGFIHSFNGPHSLFIDTMRTLRVLAVAHQLGHVLTGE